MSKVFSPKAWYLVGIGAAALAFDGARRLLKKRREDMERVEVETTKWKKTSPTVPPAAAAQPKASASTPSVAATPPIAEITPSEKPSTPAKPASSMKTKDSLTEIKGIGPVFAKRLADAGITTFAALAKTSPERLREVTNATAAADPDEWIAQARLK